MKGLLTPPDISGKDKVAYSPCSHIYQRYHIYIYIRGRQGPVAYNEDEIKRDYGEKGLTGW